MAVPIDGLYVAICSLGGDANNAGVPHPWHRDVPPKQMGVDAGAGGSFHAAFALYLARQDLTSFIRLTRPVAVGGRACPSGRVAPVVYWAATTRAHRADQRGGLCLVLRHAARAPGGALPARECWVPLQALCATADVELLQGRLVNLDPAANSFELADGRRFSAAWLSLNPGSQPKTPQGTGSELELLPVKPFEAFLKIWDEWHKSPQPLAILGGRDGGGRLARLVERPPRPPFHPQAPV